MAPPPRPPAADDAKVPPPPPPEAAEPPRRYAAGRLISRHATGLTVVLFLVLGAGLGAAPGLPDWLRPVDLSTDEARTAVLDRIFKQPTMTFEAWSEGTEDDEDEIPGREEGEDQEEPGEVDADDEPDEGPLVAEGPTDDEAGEPADEEAETYTRTLPAPGRETKALRRYAARLDAPGAEVENPCVRHQGNECARTALDPFFAALDAIDRGERGTHATVLTLGNSLIASDHVTDIVRERLVERFGDGGRGFLLPDRISKIAGRRVRTGYGTKSWRINTFAQKPPKRAHFGFTGSTHESTRKNDRTTWRLRGADTGRLFWLDHPGSAPFRLEVDGEVIAEIKPSAGAPTDKIFDFAVPKGGKKLVLIADGPEVVIYGVALTENDPGVSWDTIGVPASDSEMYVEKTDEQIFIRQLQAREPDLVVVMVGGNETRSLAFDWTDIDEVRGHYAALIDRIRTALPGVACLAVAPIDAAKATAAGAKLTTRPELLDVVAMERSVAREKGCAFFNLFEAMGGEGSLHRFRRAGFVHDDLVHPKGKGGDILGQLFADALLQSWVDTPPPKEEIKTKRRLVPPRLAGLSLPGPATPTTLDELPFRKLSGAMARAERRRGRLAIGQFGDEHTAGEVFTSRVRSALKKRFGALGRGVVPAAGDEGRLAKAGIKRRLIGRAEVHDGRDVVLGGAMGLGGTAVRLTPSARFDVTFCHGCESPAYVTRGYLELAWLYTPDMGRADVLVNNVQVGALSPESRQRTDTDVQYLRIPVRGQAHTLSVIVPPDGGGPVNLFSVAQELAGPGLIVDSVGLDHTTGMTMQRWRQELYGEQVRRRDYDLVIAAWGSQEADIQGLDETTYRHHLSRSVRTLREHAAGADCLLMAPFAQRDAPRVELVRTVQRAVAEEQGCGLFDPNVVLPRRKTQAAKAGLYKKGRLTAKGYRRMAEALVTDLVAWHEYTQAKEQDLKERAAERGRAAPPSGVADPAPPAPAPTAPEG